MKWAAAAVVVTALAAVACGSAEGPGVVTVLVDRPSGVAERATGFVAAPGQVVTVAHVLDGGGAVAVEGHARPVRVIRVDRANDLALLDAGGVSARRAGGDGVRLATPRGEHAVTVRRHMRARVRDSAGAAVYTRAALELGATVSAGDSGAPVLDDGELLGVVFARSRRHDGTAYAVDAAAVERLLRP